MNTDDANKSVEFTTDLVIGLESQPDEYQLGQPIRVRTDDDGNIYIADKASLTIKIFDKEGDYIKSIGGRGKEENKFHDFEFMEFTSDGDLVFMDRRKLQYSILTKDGEPVITYPYNLSDQFYPSRLDYINQSLLALQLDADIPSNPPPLFERDFFFVYSTDFQEMKYSFFSYKELDVPFMMNTFAWISSATYRGSYNLSEFSNQIVFSPGIYNGKLYKMSFKNGKIWEYVDYFKGVAPSGKSIIELTSNEHTIQKKYPAVSEIHFGEGIHRGRLYSVDTGIFQLDDGRIIHFFGEWRGGDTTMEEGNLLEIDVQFFDKEFELIQHEHLFRVEIDKRPRMPLVNWKDKDDNFYLIDTENGIPVVRRFQLQIPES